MDPSSLIFVAIVAIWAVYLLGHWARRRDLLATARSVDRFSEAMRVLERRPPQPLAASRSGSPVVPSPRRVSPAPSAAPMTASTVLRAHADEPGRASVDGRAPLDGPAPAPRAAGRPAPGRGPARRPVGHRPAPDTAARKARGLVLLGLLVVVPTTWLLSALSPVPAWLPLLLTLALAAQLVHLRRMAVRRRQDARRHAGAARASAGRRGDDALPGPAAGDAPAEDAPAEPGVRAAAAPTGEPAPQVAADGTARAASAGASGATDARDGELPGTGRPGTDSSGTAVAGRPVETPVDGGWQPVPVPPPTYTLKPKAPAPVQRPVPAAVASPEAGSTRHGPATASAAEPASGSDFDLDQILERRIASGG